MTDQKIKPSLIVYEWETQTGAIHHGLTYEPYNGVYPDRGIEYYLESALAQAEERGRIAGLREAAEIVLNGRFLHDNAPSKLFANEAAAAITRAAEGKNPPKEIDPNKWAFDRGLESY